MLKVEGGGALKGALLGLVLFHLFINDSKLGVNSEIPGVETKVDCEVLQKEFSKLGEWATKQQKQFNIKMSKVRQSGRKKSKPHIH